MRGLEIWDILDKEGNKTGKTMQKGEELPEGFYHQGAAFTQIYAKIQWDTRWHWG